MDQLKALEVFTHVAREGSLSGAARRLSISPASVTRTLNSLEQHLGAALLIRSTRSLTLTEAGMSYLESAENILEDIRIADDKVQGKSDTPHGLLRVTAPVMFGRFFIAPIIGEYIDLYPETQVAATFVDHNINMADNTADIAIRVGPLADSSLIGVRVGTLRQTISGAPSYFERRGVPSTPQDLIEHDLVNYVGPGFSPIRWTFDGDLEIPIKPRLSFNDMGTCVEMGALGHGVIRTLNYQVAAHIKSGALKAVIDEYSTTEWPIHLIFAKQLGQAAKLRAFIDLVTKRLQSSPLLS